MGADLTSLELTLVRGFLTLLYAPIMWLAFRRLLPRLLTTAKWLACVFLAAQVVAILASLEVRSGFTFDVWLLHLNGEYNFPATVAAAQFFTVACAAFIDALMRGRLRERLFILWIGLLFLLFGLDEAFLLHEANVSLQVAYIVTGMAVAAAAFFLAARAPRQNRVWYACLIGGLAISGFGAIVVEQVLHEEVCKSLGFLSHNNCLWRYHIEEPLEFIGVWLALLAVLGLFSEASPAPTLLARLALCILPALAVLLLIDSRLYGYTEIPYWAMKAWVQFDSGLHIYGFRIDSNGDTSLVVHLPRGVSEAGMGFSISLIDLGSGRTVASNDRRLIMSLEKKVTHSTRDFRPLYRQRAGTRIPADFPANRAITVVLTHWREQDGGFPLQTVLSSDRQLIGNKQVILDEIVIPEKVESAAISPLAAFGNGFALESFDMPQYAEAGQTLSITFAWRADEPSIEDHIQFLHFGHEESSEWWVYDQHPLGARLPTRLWYMGLADSEIWQVPVPDGIEPGRYKVFTGLYRASDKERVPVTYADEGPWLDNRVALSDLLVE